jgi:hypothetical protein
VIEVKMKVFKVRIEALEGDGISGFDAVGLPSLTTPYDFLFLFAPPNQGLWNAVDKLSADAVSEGQRGHLPPFSGRLF